MKIKIITCHNVYNYGASLQEYALIKYLTILGHEAKAINYRPSYLSKNFDLWAITNPKYKSPFILKWGYLLLKLPSRINTKRRKRSFDEFSKKHIPATKLQYKTNKDLINDPPLAEKYICGSDQIWNSFFPNGKDKAFYLDFVSNDNQKISYAASFAIEKLEYSLQPFVKEQVSKIRHVSVREKSGVQILKDLGINNIMHVLDPVFLLAKEEWDDLSKKKALPEKYIFVYDFDSDLRIKKQSSQFAKVHGLKIVTVNQNIKYADYNFYTEGPEVFLSIVKNATIVLSNSFHALAFSLIYHKKFIMYNRSEAINTRMKDLLELLSLDRLLVSKQRFENINEIDINFLEVEKVISNYRSLSISFLTKALYN